MCGRDEGCSWGWESSRVLVVKCWQPPHEPLCRLSCLFYSFAHALLNRRRTISYLLSFSKTLERIPRHNSVSHSASHGCHAHLSFSITTGLVASLVTRPINPPALRFPLDTCRVSRLPVMLSCSGGEYLVSKSPASSVGYSRLFAAIPGQFGRCRC